MRRSLLILLLALGLPLVLNAQRKDRELIQFSGVVLTSDSLVAVPFVNIINLSNGRGTISDLQGFFSFAAAPGDSVLFSAVGYKRTRYYIPAELDRTKYSVVQLLTRDTIFLAETVIYPWPSENEFRQAFLALEVPDDMLETARRNLEHEALREQGKKLPIDGNEATDYFFRQEAKRYYYAGQTPPIQLFNVFAWAEFIEAWKRGDFKKQN